MKKFVANITVEAAFVLPVIIYTIFALIYFAFYLHDISRIESTVNEWVYKAALSIKHPVDLGNAEIRYEDINSRGIFYYLKGQLDIETEALSTLLQEELSGGLFIVEVKEINTEISPFTVSAKVKTILKISLNPVDNLLVKYSVKSIGTTQSVHNPSEFIRICNLITENTDIANSINKLTERLNSLLGRLAQ